MPAVEVPTYWTAEMVRALPDDGKRHETVYGELLVTPAPRMWHEIVADRLLDELKRYLTQEPVGIPFKAIADISWGPDILVQPDLFVAPFEEVRTLDWARVQALSLVVEVLSPGNARTDRFTKRRLYQQVGIPLYWIVDPDAQLVECWTPEATMPALGHERIIWHPAGAREPCVIELEELFRKV